MKPIITSALFLLLLIADLFLIPIIGGSTLPCAIWMCCNFVLLLVGLWINDKLSPFFLFFFTFCLLFIGGRFWSALIDSSFPLNMGNFFRTSDFPMDVWYKTLKYIVVFMYSSSIAYLMCPSIIRFDSHPTPKPSDTINPTYNWFLRILFIILFPFVLYVIYQRFMTVYIHHSYESLYIAQNSKPISSFSGLFDSLLLVGVALSVVFGDKTTKLLYVGLFAFKAMVYIVMGQRGFIGSIILCSIWYAFQIRHCNLKQLCIMLAIEGAVLIGLSSISIRPDVSNFTEIYNLSGFTGWLFRFSHAQGVSLASFMFSLEITDYPPLAYVSSFLPGVGSLSSLFGDAQNADVNFAHYLSNAINPTLYHAGNGLGWTFMSDLVVFGAHTWFGYILLSIVFGLGSKIMELLSTKSNLLMAILLVVTYGFTILPRTGLFDLFPFIIWLLAVYLGMILVDWCYKKYIQKA